MSDFEKNSRATGELVNSLFQNQAYRGVIYSNLQLYGSDISEVVDPECSINPTSISTYWPGGAPYLGESRFGTFLLGRVEDRPNYSAISGIRSTILGLELSKRALKRWDDVNATLYKRGDSDEEFSTDSFIPMSCGMSGVPLSALVLSRVLRHRKIKAGQTVAHMYFPTALKDPRIALNELKEAQRVTIAAEQI